MWLRRGSALVAHVWADVVFFEEPGPSRRFSTAIFGSSERLLAPLQLVPHDHQPSVEYDALPKRRLYRSTCDNTAVKILDNRRVKSAVSRQQLSGFWTA
jgi:hypothetical protein